MAAAAQDLCTIEHVKIRLFPEDNPTSENTEFDTLLQELVTQVSDQMQDLMGREINDATYTEYYDGTGTSRLMLRQGPLISVTSVNSVAYSDDGADNRTETLTELTEPNRLEYGRFADGHLGLAEIQYLGCGKFTTGQRNWKVVYVAGFETVPESLNKMAAEMTIAEFYTRNIKGQSSRALGDGASINVLTPIQMSNAMERAIKPYRVIGF